MAALAVDAPAAENPAPLLGADDINPALVLPPPPATDSSQARAELAELHAIETVRTPNTLTGNAARGAGILKKPLYVSLRPYGKQTYRKNAYTGKRHTFISPQDKQAGVIAAPELRIVSVELWERVKARQATLARTPTPRQEGPVLPFFAQ